MSRVGAPGRPYLVGGLGDVGHGEDQCAQPLGGEELQVRQRGLCVLRARAARQARPQHGVRAFAEDLDGACRTSVVITLITMVLPT